MLYTVVEQDLTNPNCSVVQFGHEAWLVRGDIVLRTAVSGLHAMQEGCLAALESGLCVGVWTKSSSMCVEYASRAQLILPVG